MLRIKLAPSFLALMLFALLAPAQAFAACSTPTGAAGSLNWNGTVFQYCDGTTWQNFSGGQWTTTGSNIYYTTGAVGIGTSSPSVRVGEKLDVAVSANYGGMALSTWSAATTDQSSLLDFNRSKSSTFGTYTAVASGDNLGNVIFRGSDGTTFTNSSSIQGFVDGTVATSQVPGRLIFNTASSAGTLTERLRIDSSGNVGIGTTVANPLASSSYGRDLTIANTTSTARAILELWSNVAPTSGVVTGQISFLNGTSPSGPAAAILSQSNGTTAGTGTLGFYTSPSAGGLALAMTVDTAGKVGIGTGSPALLLHLQSGSSPALRFQQDTTGGFTAQTWDIVANEATFSIRDLTGGSKLPFRIAAGAATNSIYINSSGSVGIGTSSPSALLHVNGMTRILSLTGATTVQNANDGLWLVPGSNGNFFLDNLGAGGLAQTILGFNTTKTTGANSVLSVYNNATDHNALFTVTSAGSSTGSNLVTFPTGSVGIGTASPGYKLSVAGTAQKTAALTDAGVVGGSLSLYDSDVANGAGSGGALLFTSAVGNGERAQAAIKSILVNGTANGTGDLAFSTRNATSDTALTERMRILSGGSVGIGTASPGATLHVNGATSWTSNGWARSLVLSHALQIGYGSGNRWGIGNDGNFVVFKATVDNTSAGSSYAFYIDGTSLRTTIGAYGAAGSQLGVYGNAAVGTSYYASAAPTSGLIVEGNVGIGTATPASGAKLDVNGVIVANGGSSSNWASLNIGGTNGINSAGSIYSYTRICAGNNAGNCNSSGGVVIEGSGSNAYGSVYISGSGTSYLNGGNVGIGQTSASYRLDVLGAASTWSAHVGSNDGNSQAYFSHPTYAVYGASAGASSFGVYGTTTGASSYGVYASTSVGTSVGGQFYHGSSGYYCTLATPSYSIICSGPTSGISDRRLKKDIHPLEASEGLSAIMQIEPVHYRWKDERMNKAHPGGEIGFIAQNVETVLPLLVSESPQPKDAPIKLEGGKQKSLQYDRLAAPLVKAVQELKHMIDDVVAKLTAHEDRLKKLEDENKAMRDALCKLDATAAFCRPAKTGSAAAPAG